MNYYLLTTTDGDTYAMVAKTPEQAVERTLDSFDDALVFVTVELTTKEICDEHFN